MDKYEYVLTELKRRKAQLDTVAENTDVSKRTLYNIISEKYEPRMSTLNSVHDYLKANQRKKML
jgi:DNA-binding phage protein